MVSVSGQSKQHGELQKQTTTLLNTKFKTPVNQRNCQISLVCVWSGTETGDREKHGSQSEGHVRSELKWTPRLRTWYIQTQLFPPLLKGGHPLWLLFAHLLFLSCHVESWAEAPRIVCRPRRKKNNNNIQTLLCWLPYTKLKRGSIHLSHVEGSRHRNEGMLFSWAVSGKGRRKDKVLFKTAGPSCHNQAQFPWSA